MFKSYKHVVCITFILQKITISIFILSYVMELGSTVHLDSCQFFHVMVFLVPAIHTNGKKPSHIQLSMISHDSPLKVETVLGCYSQA